VCSVCLIIMSMRLEHHVTRYKAAIFEVDMATSSSSTGHGDGLR
jgi:hypothetical protein